MPYKNSLGRRPRKITLRLPEELFIQLSRLAVMRDEPLAVTIRRLLRGCVGGA